jgi:CheY-like chemotaxis protein
MRSLFSCPFPRIVVVATAACCCLTAHCQDGDNGEPVQAVGIRRDVQTPQSDPFAEQQMSVARRGNRQMANAISSLARTGRWSEVNRLLERLASQNLNVATLAEMQKQIGPAVFLQMRLNDQLSDNANLALDRLATASNEFLQSPQRLRAAISQLEDVSTDRRLAASRVLIEGENASIIELVSAAIATDPPAERKTILRALLRQGPGGVSALQQLALYGTATVRAEAVESLALIDTRAHAIDLLTSLHSGQSVSKEVEVARQYLSRVTGGLPSRTYAVDRLLTDLEQKQATACQTDSDDEVVVLWSINKDQAGVQFRKTRAIYAAYRDAADAAARLRRVGALTPQILAKVLVSDMGYRIMIDPDWGDKSQVDSVLASYGSILDSNGLSAALDYALDIRDYAASLGLIRLIGSQISVHSSDEFIRATGPEITPLVAAASSPIARIRYEAALTVSRLADGTGYAGSSQVKRALSEMVRLADLPTVVLVETRPEVIAPIQQVVARFGFRGVTVANASQLRQCLDRGGDIRLIITKTQLSDLLPIELIDVIRRTSRGNQLPIVLYGANQVAREELDPELHGSDSVRWDGPTEWVQQPAAPSAYVGILDRIERQRRLPPLSSVDRQRFRHEASEFLDGTDSDL